MPLQFHAALMVGWRLGCERFRLLCVCVGGGGGGFWALCACLSIYFCAVLPFFVIADGVPYHL